MKLSKYNFFIPLDEQENFLAFNSLKNGLAIFPKKLVESLQAVETGGTLMLPDKILDEIKRGGFICDDTYNEFGLIQIRRHIQQYGFDSSLGLTISPSLACNLKCSYCPESQQKSRMDQTVIERIVEFIKKRIESGLKSLSVVWYGGEPLLCLDIIEALSRKLLNLCEQNHVEYKASIVTNGTLFTRGNAEILKSLKVTGAQITLDGDKEMHDSRRPFRDGKGSFDRILSNIIETAGIIPIRLRINVDRKNVDAVLDFIKTIQSDSRLEAHFINKNIVVHYGHVRKFTASCRCSEEECLKPSEFWLEELQLRKYLYNKGIDSFHYPSRTSGCVATTINSYVIGDCGELYKCWNHIGEKEKVVGFIGQDVKLESLYISYLTESFETDDNCKECKVLPICMGGCVEIRIGHKQGRFDSIDCSRWKYYLEESLKAYYFAFKEKQKTGECI